MFFDFLGLGFGLPQIFDAPFGWSLTCGSQDFQDLVQKFGLERGLQPLYDDGHSPKAVSIMVKEFSTILKVRYFQNVFLVS